MCVSVCVHMLLSSLLYWIWKEQKTYLRQFTFLFLKRTYQLWSFWEEFRTAIAIYSYAHTCQTITFLGKMHQSLDIYAFTDIYTIRCFCISPVSKVHLTAPNSFSRSVLQPNRTLMKLCLPTSLKAPPLVLIYRRKISRSPRRVRLLFL